MWHDDDESDLGVFGWAERDQFVYYLTIAYMLTDPADWPTFRRAVYGGLVAAIGLHPAPTGPYLDPRALPNLTRRRHAWQLLDRIRDRYDPADNWAGFLVELWDRRHELTEPTTAEPSNPS